MTRRAASLVALVAMLTACSAEGPTTAPEAATPALANAVSDDVRDRYIVVFKEDVQDAPGLADQLVRAARGRKHFVYERALKGFAATIPEAALDGLRRNPNVAYIESDAIVTASGTQSPATWGLDRIDQRDLPLSGSYTYDTDGSGVTAYIIDTGILFGHVEFGGRATTGYDAVTSGGTAADCNGHGTHVAGTVGGATYGVAKQAALVAVRVLGCSGSGSTSGVIAGIDWVTNNAIKPAVANMSLGGSFSASLNTAVANAVAAGVTFAVAAGNENTDACTRSPASAPNAITVAATTSGDARASYSNFGSCVDLFAPGSSITSAWYTSTTATNTISGTSMASPHVAGVAALYLAANPGSAPTAVAAAVTGGATSAKVTSPGTGSPNLLLYSLLTGGSTPPPVISVHVQDISGAATPSGRKNWTARVTIAVRQVDGTTPVSSATVTGNWGGGATGATSCITGTDGTCSVSRTQRTTLASVAWTVAGIAGAGMTYEGAQNVESSVTVARP